MKRSLAISTVSVIFLLAVSPVAATQEEADAEEPLEESEEEADAEEDDELTELLNVLRIDETAFVERTREVITALEDKGLSPRNSAKL